jgi:D-amino-acid oxidase
MRIAAECQIYNRSVDASSTTADWFSELLSTSPWFKDVVPNVSTRTLEY